MNTDDLREKYGKSVSFNCEKGDEAFTDGYVMWLEKQLLIQRVSQQRELLEAYTKQIKEDNEFTEEITFQDINKCIASNCG